MLLSERKFLKPEDLLEFVTNPMYTRVEFTPKADRKARDIPVNVFTPYSLPILNGIVAMIGIHAKNPSLPSKIKDKLQSKWDKIQNRKYISEENIKLLITIQKEYNVDFCIPKKLRKSYESKSSNQ